MTSLLALSLLLPGCTFSTLITQGRSLPTVEGSVQAKGLAGKVTLSRDSKGIPHIRAGSEADALYAVGYAHGQDRMFQMDLLRRMALGQTAELLGPEFAEFDLFMQALDIRSRAEDAVRAMDPDTRFTLASYAAGVNAATTATKKPPVEYRLLKDERAFQEWTPADSLCVVYLNSWFLATNPGHELASFLMRDELDRKDLDAMFQLREGAPKADPYWKGLRETRIGDLTPQFRRFLEMMSGLPAPGASNNWAVAPERSADGGAILANDPHLVRGVPSVWYLVEYAGGDVHVAGSTMPGLPWVISGHNETLAWGMTNVMADYVDFAVLQRDGDKGYLLAGEKKTLVEKALSVPVREAEAPHSGSVYMTDIGPVVSELDGDHLLVMRWSALEIVDESAAMLRDLSRTATVEEVLAEPAPPSITSLNVVLADTEGEIGWQVTGAIPKRLSHSGRLPYPGSSEYHGWDGWLTELPQLQSPESGYIVTANNRPQVDLPAGTADIDAITSAYIAPWRHDRIVELLTATDKHSLDSFGDIQADRLDTHARDTLPALLEGLEPKSVGARWCIDQLRGWDYGTDPRSVAPLVYNELHKQLVIQALKGRLEPQDIELYLSVTGPGESLVDIPGGLEHFSSDTDALVRQALLATYDSLVATYGEDPSTWEWGEAHAVDFRHPFDVGLFNPGEIAWGGSANTVNVGSFSWETSYETTWIPSLRIITPMSDVSRAEVVFPPGQSGQPASSHYQDMLRPWSKGHRVPLYFSDEDVQRHADEVLELTP